MLRAIIVDDEQLAVRRLQHILAESLVVEVCHTFLNPWEAYEYVQKNRIQLAFLDITMPKMNGMMLSTLLQEFDPSIAVIFVTGYDDYAVEAFEINALDYLMKPVTSQRMFKALDKVRQLHKVRQSDTIRQKDNIRQKEQHPQGVFSIGNEQRILTEREVKIVELITDGLTNKQMASQLDISTETVKSHLKNIYRKLEVSNRVQVLRRAQEWNILQ